MTVALLPLANCSRHSTIIIIIIIIQNRSGAVNLTSLQKKKFSPKTSSSSHLPSVLLWGGCWKGWRSCLKWSIDDLTLECGRVKVRLFLIGRPCHSGTSKPWEELQLCWNGRITSLYCTPLKKQCS